MKVMQPVIEKGNLDNMNLIVVHKLVFMKNLFTVKQDTIYDVRKNILIICRYLFRNVFCAHSVLPFVKLFRGLILYQLHISFQSQGLKINIEVFKDSGFYCIGKSVCPGGKAVRLHAVHMDLAALRVNNPVLADMGTVIQFELCDIVDI